MSLVQNLTEKQELLIGTAVFALCNSTFLIFSDFNIGFNADYIIGTVIAAILGAIIFYTHEYVHLWLAKRKKIYVNFRIIQEMTFLSFITAMLPVSFKFIAPGIIFMENHYSDDRNQNMSIYLSGSITTLFLASILLICTEFISPTNPILIEVFHYSARSALYLTLFSLIPFFFFDGESIYKWNKFIWGGLISISLISLIFLR